jgi:hypothetical protein
MKVMKIASIIIALIIGAWAIITIIMLWNSDFMKFSTYIKTTITMGVIAAAVGIIALIIREFISEQKMKKDKYID